MTDAATLGIAAAIKSAIDASSPRPTASPAARSRQQYPKENGNTGAIVLPLRQDLVSPESRTMVFALSGAAVCVLSIVCAIPIVPIGA